MGGYGKGKYGGSWGGNWGSNWGDDWSSSRAWKGSSKGKGKGQEEAEAEEAAGERTGRILSRYQYPKAIMKTAAGQDGSAFVKDSKKPMDDITFLSGKQLKKVLGPQNHHLLRRPGVGLSEAAGSIQSGADVASNISGVDFGGLASKLCDAEVASALQVLNTLDTDADHSAAKVAESLQVLSQKLCDKNGDFEEMVVKATVATSRLYLAGTHLLVLLQCLKDPEWWCSQVPTAISEHKHVKAWQASPADAKKMGKAMAALLSEKMEEAASYGKNDAAALFSKKRPAKAEDADSGSEQGSGHGDKKKKKSKKEAKGAKDARKKAAKKAKKKKEKTPTPTSSSSSKSSSTSDSSKKKKSPAAAVPAEKAEKKETKEDEAEKRRRRLKQAPQDPVVKVRRVSGMTPDNRIIAKEDDLFDEVAVTDKDWTLQDLLAHLLAQSGAGEDVKNWNVKILEDGFCKPVALESTPAALHKEVVLIRRGG